MIPTIGVMIGFYILTRMIETFGGTDRKLVKAMSAVTAVVAVLGTGGLLASGVGLPLDLTDGASPRGSYAADALADSILVASGSVPKWTISESTNPLDDSPTVVLRLEASTGSSRLGERPSLILRCMQNETDVYVNWNDYLGSDAISVTSRLGRAESQTSRWGLSTDNTSTFYPGRTTAFIREIAAVDTLVLNTTPYNESPVTAVFDVRGLSAELAPLQRACGWE